MEEDRFDRKIIDIESRSFEINMLMAGFVYDVLHFFNDNQTEISCEIPYCDPTAGYRIITAESISLESEKGIILISAEGFKDPVFWDDLSLTAKDLMVMELHHKYKSLKLLESLNSRDEIH